MTCQIHCIFFNRIDLFPPRQVGENWYQKFVSESWESYLERMTKPGEWGDHVVLVGLAKALHRKIEVISSRGAEFDLSVDYSDNSSTPAIRLGHLVEFHYMSLIQRKFMLLSTNLKIYKKQYFGNFIFCI